MRGAKARAIRFVRGLVGGATAVRKGAAFALATRDGSRTLGAADVEVLISDGVLTGDRDTCRAGAAARGWLRRQMAETDEFGAQHRNLVTGTDGHILNLAESPLARLAAPPADGAPPFLEPHQVEAGERVRRLAERARLQPRVTMSYDPAHTPATKGSGHAADIGEIAADARKLLAEVHRALPRDCAEVVLDVCGLLKGLQVVESERGWPRRSAKLVLRIGLDQLARHYGLAGAAIGPARQAQRSWLDEGARPTVVG